MTIRVVVVDDQDLVRTGLVMIVNAHPDFEVVGEAENIARLAKHLCGPLVEGLLLAA